MFWVMWITIPKRVVMKDPKKDNIHHFADEFAFEDLKHESGGEGAHHAKSYPTKDSQISMIMKQISHLNTPDREAGKDSRGELLTQSAVS